MKTIFSNKTLLIVGQFTTAVVVKKGQTKVQVHEDRTVLDILFSFVKQLTC